MTQTTGSGHAKVAARMEALLLQFGQQFTGARVDTGFTGADHHDMAVVVRLGGRGFQCECWHGDWGISL